MGHTELAAVGRAVRDAYVRELDPEVTEVHLAAILAEAERVAAAGADLGAAPAAPRRSTSRRALAVRLAAVVASAFVASAGLAIAGVRPPEPFSDVFEGVGFDVPGSDRSGDDEASPTGQDRRENSPVAPAAPPGGAQSVPSAREGTPTGGEQRSAQGDEASSEGRETASQAQSGNTPPSDPGRSEDHPDPPVDPPLPSQAGGAGTPDHSQAGGADPPAPLGGGVPPTQVPVEPLIDPVPVPEEGEKGQSASAPGASIADERRSQHTPRVPTEAEVTESDL
ncbi:MAG TPA: hypothetical protein VHF58_02265 [Solirubrobacterales bacterium]|nr:hypothetical protein [Solirubrobacterales bacterium]